MIFMGTIWAPSIEAVAVITIFGIVAEITGRLSIGIGVTLERRRAHARAKHHLSQIEEGHLPENAEMEFPLPHHVARMLPGGSRTAELAPESKR